MKVTNRIPSVLLTLGSSVALALLAIPAPAQDPVRVYVDDIRVNDYTHSNQSTPAVTPTPDGGFVVVWTSLDQWIPGSDVFVSRVPGLFHPPTVEQRVNSYTTGTQIEPAAASDKLGNVLVVWTSVQDGSQGSIFGQRYDYFGRRLGGEFQVNEYTTGPQSGPAVAADGNGAFIVVWHGSGQGDSQGIFGRRYRTSDGSPIGGEFRVNAWVTGVQDVPSVAAAAEGEFVVAWGSGSQPPDGANYGVFARRFSAAGDPQGPEFLVSTITTRDEWRPAVASDRRSNFVVVWERLLPVNGDVDRDVFGRAYDRLGAARGPEFRVNAFTTDHQLEAAVAVMACGNFVVTWRDAAQDGSTSDVFARYFEDWGAAPGAEFRVNSYTTTGQGEPVVASQPGGQFLEAWNSHLQDGSGTGIFGQRYRTDLILKDGFAYDSWLDTPWSSRNTGGGALYPAAQAALNGTTHGLLAVVSNTSALWLEDNSPQYESRYGARFYFDTNGFDPGEAFDHRRIRLFVAFGADPTGRLFAVVLRRLGGAYALMGRVRLDDGSHADTGFFPIDDGVHFVELSWSRSSPGAANGSFSLWIDGTPVATLADLDNSRYLDYARLGAIGPKLGASGTLYLDEFESRRFTNIGP